MTTGETISSDAMVAALIGEIDRRLPSTKELVALPDDGILDPEITLPAIWLRIVLAKFRSLEHRVERHRMVFGSQIAELDAPGEFARAFAIRACAKGIVDALLGDIEPGHHDRAVKNVMARLALLPLAPIPAGEGCS